MNEIQIIQKQLATERAHFDEVAQACAAWLRGGGHSADRLGAHSRGVGGADAANAGADRAGANAARTPNAAAANAGGANAAGARGSNADGNFAAACADYFAFAVTRFDAPKARQLAAQLAGGPRPEFLQVFTEASRQHFERLDAMLSRNLPVTEWRAVSRIDADSIFAERTLYSRVKATIPP
jgi:hypothetical protein